MNISEFNFTDKAPYGLFLAAGGFEKRALTFVRRVDVRKFKIEKAILLRYITQHEDNEPNFNRLKSRVERFTENIEIIDVDIDIPDKFMRNLVEKVRFASASLNNRSVVIDISSMAHVLICFCLRSADISQLQTRIVYTEASDYYPRKSEWDVVIKAVERRNFKVMAKYLQTAGLKDIEIPTEFKGNTRPGFKTCLFVMAGYEPNRVQGLIDDYAPNAIVAFYGKSPHERLHKRQDLSRALHRQVFDGWRYKEIYDLSTLEVEDILNVLETEYKILRAEYDVAIASQCSKMQTLASYLFWKRHPEIQLVFTTAVRIEPKRYSRGEGRTFCLDLS
jgi:hypothetical protein